MKVNLFIVLAVSLITLINQSNGQVNNHYLTVEQFIPPNADASTFRCNSAIISPRHAIATANCVNVTLPFWLGVRHFITIAGVTTDTISSVERVSMHPEYIRSQAIEFNIAVIETTNVFNVLTPPRPLGTLSARSFCQLLGWGARGVPPRQELVIIFSSLLCDPIHSRLFCSIYLTSGNPICAANLGSPVTCSAQGELAGILINEGTCTSLRLRNTAQYISIGHFTHWINCEIASSVPCDMAGSNGTTTIPPTTQTTTQSGMAVKASVILIVSALLSATLLKN